MNSNDLSRLLDEAAASFDPVPDVARLEATLNPHGARHRSATMLSIAAATLLFVGSAGAVFLGGGADPNGSVVGSGEPAPAITTAAPAATHAAPTTADGHDTAPIERVAPSRVVIDEHDTGTTTTTATVPVTSAPVAIESAANPAPTTTLAPAAPTTKAPAPTTTKAPAPAPAPAPTTTHAPAPTAAPTTQAPAPTDAPTTTHAPTTTAAPTTTTAVGAFSANQTWFTCGSNPPYDEFFGTGSPGSTISVNSPYGSGSTTVDSGGHWYVQVFFPSAPVGVQFGVTVAASTGESASMSFTRTA